MALATAQRLADRTLRLLAGALLAAALAAPSPAQEGESLEYPIKATFLVRFAVYVSWPQSAFASPTSPLYICVVGNDPFGGVLDAVAEGQAVGDHPLQVRRLAAIDRGRACHILYIGGADPVDIEAALGGPEPPPMLTVTDAAQTIGGRGVIHFVIDNDRVRFHIDDAEAARRRLALSSQLLGVALSVRERSQP